MKKENQNSKKEILKINTQNLLNALQAVKPGLANKEFVETTTHYLFTDNKIITYNDKICISYPCDYFTNTFSVKAKDFFNIIKTIKDETFACKITKGRLLLKSKDTEAGININVDDFLVKDMYDELGVDDLEFQPLNNAEDFKRGLELCRFSTSKDATHGYFYCVSVGENSICSSDNYRASYYKTKDNVGTFLVPASAVNELVNYSFNEICIDDNWVHFRNDDGLIFSSRLVEGEYPDFKDMLNDLKEEKEIILPEKLKNLLDEISVMAKGETDVEKSAEIVIENKVLTCKAQKDIGYLKKKMPIDYKGTKIYIQINPTFLQQILSKSNNLYLTDKGALFVSDSFKHMIAILTDEE